MFRPQKVKEHKYFLLRIPNDNGGPGNPSAPIDVNALRTTNFRSSCAVWHFTGITRRDGPTDIRSIALLSSGSHGRNIHEKVPITTKDYCLKKIKII